MLLIEAHPEPNPEKLKLYTDWLEPYFEVKPVHVSKITSTEVKEDAIVVTGSEWQILKDPVPEMITKLYLEAEKPLLGICWGHQTLAHAWGAGIIKTKFIDKNETIRVLRTEELLDNMGLFFAAQESHYEHVVRDGKLKRHFEVLAYSSSCKVEVIRHSQRPLWGVQFHPERSGSSSKKLAANFAKIVVNQ